MRRTGLWWAAALVVASNLGAWGFAAWNHSAEPEAVLELTQRELRLPAKQTENTALSLELVFERAHPPGPARSPQEPGWFDRTKLQSIGFDCSKPVTKEHVRHYQSQPPRSTYAALELEGEAWRRQMAEPPPDPAQAGAAGRGETGRTTAPTANASERNHESRLVAIDVGNDPSALRQRYPDRHRVAIVEARAVLRFVDNPGQSPFLAGRVTSILPSDINVPRTWLGMLGRLQTDRTDTNSQPPLHEPWYRVTVKWGKNLEPWIADVQLTAAAPAR